MKIWVDDLRPAPIGYTWAKSVDEAKQMIIEQEEYIEIRLANIREMDEREYKEMADYLDSQMVMLYINLIDIDHDAGDYAKDGGDYIKLLDWLEETNRRYPIRLHSMNPVGVQNMRAIIQRNGWVEVR